MPKKEFVFKSCFDVEDTSSSSSDSEIEVIPYVKPAPVVIDLLEESDHEGNGNEEEDTDESRRKKKKSKKKKSKKDKERHHRGDGGQERGSTSCGAGLEDDVPSVSLPFVEQNGVESEGENGGSSSNVPSGHDVEPSISSSSLVDDEPTGSGNEAGRNRKSTAEYPSSSSSSSQKTQSSGVTRKGKDQTSSGSERCDDAQSKHAESEENVEGGGVGESLETGANMVGTPSTSQQAQQQLESSSTGTRKEKRKTRKRNMSATTSASVAQRTDEEIITFLNLIGIELEARPYGDTPTRKGRKPRKRLVAEEEAESQQQLAADDSNDGNNNTEVAAAGTSSATAFVAVTDESSSTPNKHRGAADGPGRKRKRQAVDGDLYDFQISFTNQDLNALNTNIQTNIVQPDSSSMDSSADVINQTGKNYEKKKRQPAIVISNSSIAAAIDAVAKGLDPENRAENATDSLMVTEPESPATISCVEEISSSGSSIQAVSPNLEMDFPVDAPSSKAGVGVAVSCKATDKMEVDLEEIECVLDVSSGKTDIRQKRSTPSKDTDIDINADRKKKNRTKDKQPDQENIVADPKIPTNSKKAKRSEPSQEASSVLKETDKNKVPDSSLPVVDESIAAARPLTPESFVLSTYSSPSTWTPHMKDFYNAVRDENFELEHVWPDQTDAPEMWVAPDDLMRPPKSKRNRHVRCHRCQQFGHIVKECSEPFKPPCCHMCGQTGHTSNHESRRNPQCSESQCLNCSKKLNQYAQKCYNCLLKRNPSRCSVCNVMGHGKEVCPDNWRRFHSVTSVDQYEKAMSVVSTQHGNESRGNDKRLYFQRAKSSMYCCNCGKRGHSFYECNGNKYNPYHRNKPFVVNDLPVIDALEDGGGQSVVATLFDAKTGRTVVVNSDGGERSAVEVETIQVQFTNELAGSPLKVSTKCEREEGCRNVVRPGETCHQTIIQPQPHTKFMKAKQEGRLKCFEDKHVVQICVIPDTNKIHICGEKSIEAETDLYRLLWEWERAQARAKAKSEAGTSQSTAAAAAGDQNKAKNTSTTTLSEPECITLDDDEDDICVIHEVPAKAKESSAPPESIQRSKEQQEEENKEKKVSSGTQTASKFSQNSGGGGSAAGGKGNPDSEREEKPLKKGLQQGQSPGPNPNNPSTNRRSRLMNDYESPLAGFSSLSGGQNQYQEPPPPPYPPQQQGPSFGFDQFNQQLPPNPNPFFFNFNVEDPTPPPPPQFLSGPGPDLNANPFFNPYQSDFNPFDVQQRPGLLGPNPWTMNGPFSDNPFETPPEQQQQPPPWPQYEKERNSVPWTDHSPPIRKQPKSSPKINRSENKSRSAEKGDDFNPLDDIEVIDHSNDSTSSAVGNDVEIVTVEEEEEEDEDDKDDEQSKSSSPQTASKTTSQKKKDKSEKVTLLESEWKLVTDELLIKDNVMNKISRKFGVDFMVSKESNNHFVHISRGTGNKRQWAKDNIISWLENKCTGTPFQMLPRGDEQTRAQKPFSPAPKKQPQSQQQNRSVRRAARALLLKDTDSLQKKRFQKRRQEMMRLARKEERRQKTLSRLVDAGHQEFEKRSPSKKQKGMPPWVRNKIKKQQERSKSNPAQKGGGGGGGGGGAPGNQRYFNNNLS